jgi:hypothetical protein
LDQPKKDRMRHLPSNQGSVSRRLAIATLACLAMASLAEAHQPLLAGADSLREVALGADNSLTGTVVDGASMPQANHEVWLASEDGRIMRTRTDASGQFKVRAISPGIYSIDTPNGGGRFRIWNAKDAPRDTQRNVLLVVGKSSGRT